MKDPRIRLSNSHGIICEIKLKHLISLSADAIMHGPPKLGDFFNLGDLGVITVVPPKECTFELVEGDDSVVAKAEYKMEDFPPEYPSVVMHLKK